MFSKIKTINNVPAGNHYFDKNNNLSITFRHSETSHEVVLYDKDFQTTYQTKKSNPFCIYVKNGRCIILFLENSTTEIISSCGDLIQSHDFILDYIAGIQNIESTQNIYLLIENNAGVGRYAKVSKEDFSIQAEYPEQMGFSIINAVVDDAHFISQTKDKKQIGCFDYDNQLIWQHTAADLIDVENSATGNFTYKNRYVFLAAIDLDSANRESRSRVFCVDAYTGKIIKRYEGLKTLGFTFVDKDHLFLVVRRQDDSESLNRIDANTLELETWEIKALGLS